MIKKHEIKCQKSKKEIIILKINRNQGKIYIKKGKKMIIIINWEKIKVNKIMWNKIKCYKMK